MELQRADRLGVHRNGSSGQSWNVVQWQVGAAVECNRAARSRMAFKNPDRRGPAWPGRDRQ